jgi:hypothetical protein
MPCFLSRPPLLGIAVAGLASPRLLVETEGETVEEFEP